MKMVDSRKMAATPISRIQEEHAYALKSLYRAQAVGEHERCGEEYWRGVLKGIEAAMDTLGIEHLEYDPTGYLEFDPYRQEA